MEWTGSLAGAETDRASMLVFQIAAGQVPVRVEARIAGDPPDGLTIDVGPTTMVLLQSFAPR